MKVVLAAIVLLTVSEGLAFQSAFIKDCLEAHNEVRAHHAVPALEWSAEIAVSAQKWANHLAAIDQLQHDSSTPYGENLFYMYGGDPSRACDRAVQNWYQEVKNYDFRSPHLDDSTSHFTQLVWRDSTNVGIGTAQSKSGNFFLVARYNPRGNVDERLNDNVPDVALDTGNENNVENKGNSEPSAPEAQDQPSKPESSQGENLVYFKGFHVDSNAEGPEINASSPPLPQENKDMELRPNDGPTQGDQRPGSNSVGPEPNVEEGTRPGYVTMEISEKQKPSYAKEVYGLPIVRPTGQDTHQRTSNEKPHFSGSEEETEKRPSNADFVLTSPESRVRPNYTGHEPAEMKVSSNYAGSQPSQTNAELEPSEMSERPNFQGHEQSETKTRPNYEGSEQSELKTRPQYDISDQTEMKARPNNEDNKERNTKEGQYTAASEETETMARPSYFGYDQSERKARPHFDRLALNDMKERLDSDVSNQYPMRNKPTADYENHKESDDKLEHFASLQINDEAPRQRKQQDTLTYVPPVDVGLKKKAKPNSVKAPENTKGSGANTVTRPLNDPRAGLGPPSIAIVTPKRGKDFRVELRFTDMIFTKLMTIPGSKDYEEAKRNITKAVIVLYDDGGDDDFQEVQLISLRNGSVIATLGLLFKKDAPGHLDKLTKALLAGKLGELTVASAYESAVALPAGYLKPNRPPQRPGEGVCAQPCSQPNHCFSTGCTVLCCAFHPHKPLPHPGHLWSAALPSCPGTCDDSCFPDCDDGCCDDMPLSSPAPASPLTSAVSQAAPVNPSIICPGSCHFSCYPQCTPECCEKQYVSNPCHPSCPAYCAPSCDNACCTARKSLVNNLSRQYSRYRSIQRALARQLYLRRHFKQPMKRLKPFRFARPLRPKQVSSYSGRGRSEEPALEEYDRSDVYSSKRGDITTRKDT